MYGHGPLERVEQCLQHVLTVTPPDFISVTTRSTLGLQSYKRIVITSKRLAGQQIEIIHMLDCKRV